MPRKQSTSGATSRVVIAMSTRIVLFDEDYDSDTCTVDLAPGPRLVRLKRAAAAAAALTDDEDDDADKVLLFGSVDAQPSHASSSSSHAAAAIELEAPPSPPPPASAPAASNDALAHVKPAERANFARWVEENSTSARDPVPLLVDPMHRAANGVPLDDGGEEYRALARRMYERGKLCVDDFSGVLLAHLYEQWRAVHRDAVRELLPRTVFLSFSRLCTAATSAPLPDNVAQVLRDAGIAVPEQLVHPYGITQRYMSLAPFSLAQRRAIIAAAGVLNALRPQPDSATLKKKRAANAAYKRAKKQRIAAAAAAAAAAAPMPSTVMSLAPLPSSSSAPISASSSSSSSSSSAAAAASAPVAKPSSKIVAALTDLMNEPTTVNRLAYALQYVRQSLALLPTPAERRAIRAALLESWQLDALSLSAVYDALLLEDDALVHEAAAAITERSAAAIYAWMAAMNSNEREWRVTFMRSTYGSADKKKEH
jgi:hypothetical protein